MESISVSIIIPVYNSGKYLDECLKSVEMQSMREIEIICVDNASTDDSATIIKGYCSRDKRFAYIRNESNRGQAYSRNVGLMRAKGKYIYFVDSDDMLCKEALLNLYRQMEQDELDGILFDADILNENIKDNMYRSHRAHVYPYITNGKKMFSILMEDGEYTAVVWRQFWRREFLNANRICFLEMGTPHEDCLFSFEALMAAARIKCIQDVCYRYRKHSESITASVSKERLVGLFVCFVEILLHSREILIGENKEVTSSVLMCLNQYRRLINKMINNLLNQGVLLKEKDFKTGFYFVFFQLFMKQKNEIFDHYIIDEVMKSATMKKIIVYGYGTYGKKLVQLLDKWNVTDYIVAVSDLPTDGVERPVFQIDDLKKYREEALILIAVSDIYQAEIIENIKRLGFRHYLCVI